MSVTQVIGGLGSFNVKLSPAVPRETMERLIYFGHICVTAGRDDPRVAGDSLLSSARFVGPFRGMDCSSEGYTLSGPGMAFWLGDEDGKGSMMETGVVLNGASFVDAITDLLPDSIQPGTIGSMPGTITGTFQYQTPRAAVQFVCDTMGAAWRVNGNGTLDAGDPADLYRLDPAVAIVRRGAGADLLLRALAGQAELKEDIEDFTTRVVLYTSNTDGILAVSATADIDPALNPFRDLFGNPLVSTRLSQETTTDPATAPARAQLELNRYSSARDAVTLSASQYDITGDLQIGDWVWVFDPDARLTDDTNELIFQGERINPVKLQVNQLTWPISPGMGLAYRAPDGTWYDLTDYLIPETGDTQVTVGGYNRSLVSTGGGTGSPGTPVGVNASIPLHPDWQLPFEVSVYQSASNTVTRAQIRLTWTQPTNVDGSIIYDGAYYEVRYRLTSASAGYQYARVAFFAGEIGGTHDILIQELTPGVSYTFWIRTVDTAGNASAWSDPQTVLLGTDDIAPPTPATPTVAGSRIAVQVTHTLGLSTGGTFNLPSDLAQLEVHAGTTAGFTPSNSTLLGRLPATIGMMQATIPAIGTFPIESIAATYIKVIAVDEAGNRSGASAAAVATADLIDSAHISDLSVSKVSAGTILADWLIGADVATAFSGQRAGFNPDGFYAYDGSGLKTFEVDAATGGVSATGTIQSANTARRVVINPDLPADGAARVSFFDPDAPDGLTHVDLVSSGGNWYATRLRDSDNAQVGGVILFTATDTYFAHNIPGSVQYLKISNSGIYQTGFLSWEVSALIATLTWYAFTTAGSVTVNYGATQARTRVILATVHDSAGSNPAYVTANSATSFTLASPTARSRYFFYQSVGV